MVTTQTFPNDLTHSPNEELKEYKVNTLVKEDLEGKVIKTVSVSQNNSNGGNCQTIKIN